MENRPTATVFVLRNGWGKKRDSCMERRKYMRRFLRATIVAVAAATLTTTAMAQPTATEMIQLFSTSATPTVNPGTSVPLGQTFASDPSYQVHRGDTIYLPIWISPQRGNNASFTS